MQQSDDRGTVCMTIPIGRQGCRCVSKHSCRYTRRRARAPGLERRV
jgi:hypothetical protein